MKLRTYRAPESDLHAWRVEAAKQGYTSFGAFVRDALAEKAAKTRTDTRKGYGGIG